MAEPRFDLVIFDNDGVLVDSEAVSARIDSGLLAEYGFAITVEECTARFLGRSMASVRRSVESEGAVVPPEFEDEYHRRLFEAIEDGIDAVPGVVDLIDGVVATGTKMCVASSGDHRRIETLQAKAGLRHYFDGVTFSAEDVTDGKPAPDLFLAAAAAMGVEPARCAVIEDSPAGVAAALAAEMTVLAYAGLTPARLLADANGGVFPTMSALGASLLPQLVNR